MPTESIQQIIYMLAGMFGFTATIWAISLPAIREKRSGSVLFSFALWMILAAMVLTFIGLVIEVGDLDASTAEEIPYGYRLVTKSLIVAMLVTGVGVAVSLSELSKPPKP
ncbi:MULTISPECIES: hypothetical protein [unclassified Hyphomonas]|uniref:hypothetical protein n=1 Tax=unclassified Hyphomonas TaxID=2630699 RepID=UPI0025C5919C|nr:MULTISPECIES: hypothetical protein [unclassified Hyphomonas]